MTLEEKEYKFDLKALSEIKLKKHAQLEELVSPDEIHFAEREKKPTPEEFYRELTDPNNHDPDNYCYIIHALNSYAQVALTIFAIENKGYDPAQSIELLEEPERIPEKKLISTSIISNGHNATWGSAFFILDVPWDNFVSMSPSDSATSIVRPDAVLAHAQAPYTTPSKLIEQTKMVSMGSSYNEVVVTGNKAGKKVRIKGIGLKLTDTGERIIEPQEAGRMREIAMQMHLPLVEIIGQSRIKDCEAQVCEGHKGICRSIYINKGGHRYCFEGDWYAVLLKDVFKSEKNFCGGHNPVSESEYTRLRPLIMQQLSTASELGFLRQIDERFGLKFPESEYAPKDIAKEKTE